jgi:hypothetical protein
MKRTINVSDKMQRGYRYELAEPTGPIRIINVRAAPLLIRKPDFARKRNAKCRPTAIAIFSSREIKLIYL